MVMTLFRVIVRGDNTNRHFSFRPWQQIKVFIESTEIDSKRAQNVFKNDHTAMAVRTLQRSRRFYEFIGGRVVSKPSAHFLEIMLGDLRLHIVQGDGGSVQPGGVGLDHVCVSVENLATLEDLCARLNSYPDITAFGPFAIQDSPPLGADFTEHAEQHVPRQTLYARDPDGINLEFRCYR